MRVLILRPEPGSTATARAVTALGHQVITVPLFEIIPLAWDAPAADRFDAVVMTSANAARYGGPELARYARLPLYAVGAATAAAARAAGFDDVTVGPGDATDLADLIARQSLRTLHMTGVNHRRLELPRVTAVPVYAARSTGVVLPPAEVALVHSARAGHRLAELAVNREALSIVAISAAAGAACGGGWRSIVIAAEPREHAVLASLVGLCKRLDHGRV